MKIGQSLLSTRPSAYSVGLAYEMLVLNVLQKYGFQIKHTGGAGDGGQDFNGYWLLPSNKLNIAVVGQCKCFKKPIGPVSVREFEDVLFRKFIAVDADHTPSFQSIDGYIGVMASQSWFTSASLKTFHSSRCPMLLCQILPQRDGNPFRGQETSERNVSPSLDQQFIPGHTEQRDSDLRDFKGERTTDGCGDKCSQEKLKSTTQTHSIEGLREWKLKSTSVHGSVCGYVNEIALNNRAQRLLGSVQVVWRQETGGSDGLLKLFNHRQLHMITDGVGSTQ